jgi:hypothetical protein
MMYNSIQWLQIPYGKTVNYLVITFPCWLINSAGGGREKHCGPATTSTHIMSTPGAWVSWLQHQQLARGRRSKES